MLWQGKPIEEYSKKELIVIIEALIANIKREEANKIERFKGLLGGE